MGIIRKQKEAIEKFQQDNEVCAGMQCLSWLWEMCVVRSCGRPRIVRLCECECECECVCYGREGGVRVVCVCVWTSYYAVCV